jgi:hypothetical protein
LRSFTQESLNALTFEDVPFQLHLKVLQDKVDQLRKQNLNVDNGNKKKEDALESW